MSLKILVIRFSSLGDVILTTAIYPNLKAHWPDCNITVLTKRPYSPLLEGNPHVDHVQFLDDTQQTFHQLSKEIRLQKFDLVIDLQNSLRSWYLRLIASVPRVVVVEKLNWERRKLIWFKRTSPKLDKSVKDRILDCLNPLEVPVSVSETQLFPKNVDQILKTHGIDPGKTLIGISPGARHATKRWTKTGFIEAADRLGAIKNSEILFLGDKSDVSNAKQISNKVSAPYKNLVGWTSLPDLVAIVSKLSLLLTNDSGVLHMGEALNIPLVALFGPTVRPFGFGPYRKSSRVVEVIKLPCRPCTLHGDEQCPLKHHRCMEDLDVNAVLMACSMLLEKNSTLSGPVKEGML